MKWYGKVTGDITKIPDFIEYYEKELEDARKEVRINGSLEKQFSHLPGIVEHRFTQLQEIEAVLKYLNIEEAKIRAKAFKKFLEGYNKELKAREAERYSDGEDDVVQIALLVNEVALLRNKYLSISKALDAKNWQLSNIRALRVAGIEDATV